MDDDDGLPTPNTMLANDYQTVGTEIIQQACACAMEPELQKVNVEWKGSRIIVTLQAENLYLSAVNDDDDDENSKNNDEAKGNENPKSTTTTTTTTTKDNNKGGVDVTTIARAINAALDSNPTGQAIAQRYSIEVTTPGASNEIQGDVMFRAYQGFDVTVVYRDPKKNNNQPKTVLGRLVERNEQHVVINVKGRMSKLIRDNVVSVTLPKAKQEK